MKVSEELLRKLSKLSQLDIPEDKRKLLMEDLEKIIDWMKQLDEVDVDAEKLEEETTNRMREDIPKNPLPRDIALKNSNHAKGAYFKVPPTLPPKSDNKKGPSK